MFGLVIVNIKDGALDTVIAGDQPAAQRVMDETWASLLKDGYVSIHNMSNPRQMSFVKRGSGSTDYVIELCEFPIQ